ncbi:MAG: hypothetical protein HYR96_11715 [Deltaproteobacteria bacterium]|nr:hypothetical protein [Deltaproteobacteria bacterium]MBI3293731.1 hypothetical protein [Deltaproteobacteria bacterium]
MKTLIFFALFLTGAAFAGAPLLNCAVPITHITNSQRAELGLKFGFNFETCFKYYMAGGSCDKRCVAIFTNLCSSLTQVCSDIPIPEPVQSVSGPPAPQTNLQPTNLR